jgi:polar amino acid transport system substrate-binding protein
MMRRLVLLLILALLDAAVIAASAQRGARPPAPAEPESTDRRAVLRFLTEGDFPPFNYYDDDGILTGFNVDLARALCLEASAACDVQVRSWEDLLPALNRGEGDAVIAAHSVSARLLGIVDFTDRYFHTPGRFAGRRHVIKADISPEGLEGQRIGVPAGTAHEAYLRTFFRDSAIITFEAPELARDALAAGKIDFLFDDGIGLSFWVGGTASKECCELKGGPFYDPKYFGDGIAIATPKKDPQIMTLLNRGLKRVRASGRFEELVLRYFPNRVH